MADKKPRYTRPRDTSGNLIPEVPEKMIQKAILQYLVAKGVFHWRANTGAFKDNKGHYVTFNFPGCPDILAILPPSGTLLGIEVKRRTGKLNPDQELCRDCFEMVGAMYVVARSVDDVQTVVEALP